MARAAEENSPNWSTGTNKAAEIISGFGGEYVVEPEAEIRARTNGRAPAYTSNGVVHMSDNIDPELGVTIGNHERVHQLKQTGNENYIKLLKDTSNRIMFSDKRTFGVLSVITDARFGSKDFTDLTISERLTIMDELNAVLYGVYKTDPAAALRNFGEVFMDYDSHIRELEAIVSASLQPRAAAQIGQAASESSARDEKESLYIDIKEPLSKSQQALALTAVAHTLHERTALGKYKNAVKLLESRRTQLNKARTEMQRLASEDKPNTQRYNKLRSDSAHLKRMVTEAERKVQQLENSINIVHLKHFDGDPELLKAQINTLAKLKNECPVRERITIDISSTMDDDCFAETKNSTIVFNAKMLRDRNLTEANLRNSGNYLASSKLEDVIVHEYGHVLAREIGNRGIEFAQKALYNLYGQSLSIGDIIKYLKNHIYQYSIDIEQETNRKFNPRKYIEIIPEVMAKHNSKSDAFTTEFINILKMEVLS